MKIAILSLFSGHLDRGVEVWTREMATRLREKGHDVLVLQGGDERTKTNYKAHEVKMRILWKIRKGESFLSQILGSPYWISLNISFTVRCLMPLIKFKPDIVMPTNGEGQASIIRVFSKLLGWKMVVTGHAGLGANDKWNILMRPDVFVSPSKRGEKWARNLPIAKGLRIVHISHGVDLDKFSPKTKKINLDLERPVFLCVSSFDPFKRVDLAVRAVARVGKGSFLILGGDRESGKIDKLAKRLLGKGRYLKMRVTPDEIPRYYASSDVFSLPSTETEAFGMVYLEAMASNLPVVATDDELRRDIIGDAGILVDPTDIDAYAKALEKALKSDWGDKPRKQAEKFSWNKIAKKYEKLFIDLVK